MNKMKTIKLVSMLFCMIGMTVFASCSKDNEDLIIGKWKCIRVNAYWGETTTYGQEGVGDIYEFKSNGKLVITETDNETETHSYSVNGDILNLGGFSFTIEELTSSKLILSMTGLGLNAEEFVKI